MIKQICICILAFASASFGQVATSTFPPDDEIKKILVDRVDTAKQSVGIVVGLIDQNGRRIIAHGALAKGDQRPLNGDTIFEIGSISKVFTSLLMTDMVERQQVALDDPISKFLPPNTKTPERNGRVITLVDLSTHTSALPRLPNNMSMKDPNNPYADYSVEQLYQFLGSYTLPRDIGEKYEYSNLGGGLLGHLLARRAGMDYEALVKSRITEPLKMTSTAITLTPEMRARLAVGHDGKMAPTSNWDLPTLAGAGALRSSANDLLTFVAANLGYVNSPLAPAMARMLSVRKPTGQPGLEIALAWHIFTIGGKDIIWHNGGTGGYRTFIGYDPKARTGVVVLANASTVVGVDDIGRHLLDRNAPVLPPTAPIFQPPKQRTEITIDPKKFDAYVGRYQLVPAVSLTVTREDNHFFAQLTGQSKFELFAETERDFFFKVADAQLTFEVGPDGKATAVTLHQLGRDQRAPRVD